MTGRLPLTVGALVAIAVALVVTVGGYVGLIMPRTAEATRLRRQVSATAGEIAAAAAAAPITDEERAEWQSLEASLRQRFVPADQQFRLLVDVARVAEANGLEISDLRLDAPGAPTATGGEALAPPQNLATNAGVIRLVARHRYSELVDFLNRVARGNTYVALQSLNVQRSGDRLQSEIRLVSLRWAQ